MTEEQLREIEARANAAEDGPWAVGPVSEDEYYAHFERIELAGVSEGIQRYAVALVFCRDEVPTTEAVFIAHAREDVPALIAEVRRLRSLFTQEDAGRIEWILKEHPYLGLGEVDQTLRDLAARIRQVLA